MKKKLFILFFLFVSIISMTSCKSEFVNESEFENSNNVSQKMSEILYEKNNYDLTKIDNGFIGKSAAGTEITQKYMNDKITSISFDYSKTKNSSNKTTRKMSNTQSSVDNVITNEYTYNENSEIVTFNNNGKIFEFVYDENNNFLYGMVDGKKQYNNSYDSDGNLLKTSYYSGESKSYKYSNGNISEYYVNNNKVYSFEYLDNQIIETNHYNNATNNCLLDENNNLISFSNTDGISGSYVYDESGNIMNFIHSIKVNDYLIYLNENSNIFDNNTYINNYDKNDRKINYIINNKEYSFKYQSDDVYDIFPISFNFDNVKYNYEYDELGNITKIIKNGEVISSYKYDSLNQLIEEYNYSNGLTVKYDYDDRGNISSKMVNEKVIKAEYDNKDRIITLGEDSISYDDNGNIFQYKDKNLSWVGGRLLNNYTDDKYEINYTYNVDGIRNSKVVNGEITNFYLVNNKVIFEYNDNEYIYYLYDEKNNIIGMNYDNKTYYYVKNHLNDIIGIVDTNDNMLVSYEYDSYGNILRVIDNSTNGIGLKNPYRYRSYRYDQETNLYYLNSRYYSPEIGRFISEDDIKILSVDANPAPYANLYCYAQNNPIKYYDPNGDSVLVICGVAISTKAIILFGAALVLSLVIASQSSEIATAINSSFDEFKDLYNSLIKSIPSLWDIITKSSKPEIHHIIAQTAAKAAPARNNLIRRGGNVNDFYNLVPLKHRFHRKLHSNLYYGAINLIMKDCSSLTQIKCRCLGVSALLSVFNMVA